MRADLAGPGQGWISPHSNRQIENMYLSLFTLLTPIVTVCLTPLCLLSVPKQGVRISIQEGLRRHPNNHDNYMGLINNNRGPIIMTSIAPVSFNKIETQLHLFVRSILRI